MSNNIRLHNVFLVSEKTLKQRSLISEPMLSIYIKPAIESAQKIGLVGVIGRCLVEKLQYLVSTKTEDQTGFLINQPEYVNYKNLLNEEVTDYLCYEVMSRAIIPLRDKMRNAGIVNNTDNNYQQPSWDEILYNRRYWADTAEYYATRLREKCEDNLDLYPEYSACNTCGDKSGKVPHTYNCGIVL